jgi:hypothetical protein
MEQFSGLKLDASRDLRVGFDDYLEATVPNTNNTMAARTEGCLALLPTGNLQGSVHVWTLRTKQVKVRDQFRVLPTPDIVIAHLNKLAASDGYSRGSDPLLDSSIPLDDEDDDIEGVLQQLPALLDMMPIDGRADATVQVLPIPENPEPTAGVVEPREELISQQQLPLEHEYILRRSECIAAAQTSDKELIVLFSEADDARAALRRHLQFRSNWVDKEFAFHISVRAAMRERPAEARPAILSELQQMLDKGVWHAVKLSHLTHAERKAIIRSSMFLKDKYFA